jgi:ABC-type Zn uptake system ZnuABC Zn-binding protein ZnuA
VSLPPYVDLVQRIAGPGVDVIGLYPAGASPHTFDPTPRDAATVGSADLVVLNGGLDELLHELSKSCTDQEANRC